MKTEEMLTYILLFCGALLLTTLLSGVLLPVLRRERAGQPILEIGPYWHKSKAGTPTMGGIAFVAAGLLVLLVYLLLCMQEGDKKELLVALLPFLFAVLTAAIGFLDDLKKLTKKQNLGLLAWQKYLLQLLVAGAFLWALLALELINTAIYLPFLETPLELGMWYIPLALLFLTGLTNALNLTDGLDGLLSSLVAVQGSFFFLYGNKGGIGTFSFFGVMLLGMSLGFLFFNHHPAKMFMGDTGSLFFGALVAGVGLVSARPGTVLLSGGVFVIEAASVILQVLYFKLSRGKRLFLMAPLHHHFEKLGWRETTVVRVFATAGLFFAVLAFFGG